MTTFWLHHLSIAPATRNSATSRSSARSTIRQVHANATSLDAHDRRGARYSSRRGRVCSPPHLDLEQRSSEPRGRTRTHVEVEGDVLKCLGLDIQPRRTT